MAHRLAGKFAEAVYALARGRLRMCADVNTDVRVAAQRGEPDPEEIAR